MTDENVVQPRRNPETMEALAPPVDRGLLAEEISNLSPESLLLRSGSQEVRVAAAAEMPATMQEIGRLRELSFREAGEGTGLSLDIDVFDRRGYRQLFIWEAKGREIVGGYRIGCAQELIREYGLDGLYTSTLFDFDPVLFEEMGPALEMGRSFICPEYQRSFGALLLLWKGIGHFVCRRRECATLFGPVSISADYNSHSRQLIAAFLRENHLIHPWSDRVSPRFSFAEGAEALMAEMLGRTDSVEGLSRLLSCLEEDRKGVPVLLRQYLRLGGVILGFNVDPDFSDVLDLLLMVDLQKTPERTLSRYMGREGAADFLKYHGVA